MSFLLIICGIVCGLVNCFNQNVCGTIFCIGAAIIGAILSNGGV